MKQLRRLQRCAPLNRNVQHQEQARVLFSAGLGVAEGLVFVESKFWKCLIREEEWRN